MNAPIQQLMFINVRSFVNLIFLDAKNKETTQQIKKGTYNRYFDLSNDHYNKLV